jgi:signal transduction histidine kinase
MMTTMDGPAPLGSTAGPGQERRPHPVAALAPVGAGLALGGLLLVGDDGLSAAELVRVGLVVAWALAGLSLVVRAGQRQLGMIVLAAAALGGACVLCSGILHRDPDGPLAAAAALVRPLAAGLLPAVALHLVVGLPDGRLGSRPRRVGVAVGYATGLGLGLALWAQRPALPLWPVAAAGIVAVAAGLGPSHRRFLASRGTTRQRMEWVGLAVVVVAEAALVVTALRVLTGWPRMVPEVVGAVSVLIPFALAAGASPRLVGRVDRLLAHTVSLAGLSGLVVAVYLLVVLGLGQVPSEPERALLLLSMAAAAVCALLYHPARERLTQAANRLVYGERSAPDEALRSFGARLSRAIPLEELLLQLAESLHKTMTLDAAEVWTGSEGLLERAASVPDRGPARLAVDPAEAPVVARAGVSGRAWLAVWLPSLLEGHGDAAVRVAPVAHSGELLGLLVVARRPDERFGDEDDRVLAELARQVGLALHNVRLDSALQASLDELRRKAEELQASRARIVASADAVRRRIERDLHDGAQQRLVALAVKLGLARRLVDGDLDQARGMLDELRYEVKDAVEELRSLAHGIYPPLLLDQGLAAALGSAAQRATIPTRVEAGPIGRYPADVEAAAYFCCMEALQNAMKHAGPEATVVVRAWEKDGALRFTVTDDGAGFDAAAKAGGHGFVNMGDRLGAIGGSLRVESSPGDGTSVTGVLPLADWTRAPS